MRIIKQGKLPSEKLYTCTCRVCKTEFEFKQCEAKYQSGYRNDSYLSIKCPYCSNECCIEV